MFDHEKTEKLLNELKDSTNVYHYISKYTTDFPNVTFSEFVDLMIEKRSLKKSQVIKDAGLHRTYAYQILSGRKKPSRDKVLTFAYGLKLNLEDTQRLLRISEYNHLYPKLKRDSIIIYSICNGLSLEDTNILLYENDELVIE